MTLLLLWDIDGTLLQRASEAHALAMLRAIKEVHGEWLRPEEVQGVDAAGRTDGSIARDILLAMGVPRADIDREVKAVARACARAYQELCPTDLSDKLAPGIADLLAELDGDDRFKASLVTGNLEPVARLKLARAGIGQYFPHGQGGFGSDAEDRNELPPLARRRAGNWKRDRSVIIGDTPRDISCARADGIRAIGITTGRFGAEALQGADYVVDHAAELAALLPEL